MLTKRDKKILETLKVTETENDMATKLIKFEQKYKINSLDLFLEEESYFPQFKKNKDFIEWTKLIKIFLEEKYDLNLINTIKKTPKICLIGEEKKKLEKEIGKIGASIILVPDTYENLDKIIYLAEINRNFVFVFTDNSELAKKYKKNLTVQTVLTPHKNKKHTMMQEADYYVILNDEIKKTKLYNMLHNTYNIKHLFTKKED